jgi:hypothetical protein
MSRRGSGGVTCPICRKLVLALDESGYMVEDDMRPCRHYLGESIDDDFPCCVTGFQDISRGMELLLDYVEDDRRDREILIAALAPHVPDARRVVSAIDQSSELTMEEWLLCLPELQSDGSGWEGCGPGGGGTSCYLFASAPNQRKLVERLAKICAAVEGLPPAPPDEE